MMKQAVNLLMMIAIVLLNISILNAQETALNIDSLLSRSISLMISQRYDSSEAICKKIQITDKDNPVGYLLMAAVLQTKMMDYETDLWEKVFYDNLDKAIYCSKKMLSQDSGNAWAHFYLGSAFCYKSFYLGKKNDLFSALKFGMRGISELNRTLKLDSTVYDVYFAIGSYKYWKSRKIQFITWLPFLKDERSPGIAMIHKTISHGKFSKYAAINGLAWIYLDAGQIDEALRTVQIGLKDFPDSRFFLWCLADCYFKKHDFENAQISYEKILASILTEQYNNHYNEIVCRYKLASCFHSMALYRESINQCEVIFKISLDKKIIKRCEKYFKKVKKIRKASENGLSYSLAN